MTSSTADAERPSLRGLFRSFTVVAVLVAIMWAVEILDLLPHTNFDAWGIRPRELRGLVGIPLAPFLHAGFGHLIGNTIPFLVLGCVIAVSGTQRYVQVTVISAVVSGAAVWLLGASHSDHIGASGVIFGYLTYLLARGFFERKVTYLLVGVAVLVAYGGILWGVIPKEGISWVGHIFGAVGGVVAAWVVHGERGEPTPALEP